MDVEPFDIERCRGLFFEPEHVMAILLLFDVFLRYFKLEQTQMKNIFKDLKRRDHKRYLGGLDVFKYIGPGLLVTVGFIDPGNWASNFAAGSEFGYSLLWVVTLSTIMLIVLAA